MAMSPRNIMHRLGMANDGQPCTMREIRRAFINAGYGIKKANKWIDLYFAEGILTEVGRNEEGNMLFDCEWWCNPLKVSA